MGPQRTSTTRRAAVAVLLAVFAALMLLRPLPQAVGEPVAWAVQTVTVLLACAAMLRRARGAPGRLRVARLLVTASLLMGAAGGVTAVLWAVVTGAAPPDPSPVDVIHLCYLPLVVAGLLCYPVSDTKAGSASRTLLDGVVAAGALWLVVYAVLLAPANVGSTGSTLLQLAALAHPAADIFVLGVLASVLPRVAPAARRELVITGSGLAVYAVADLGYSVMAAGDRYRADSWVSLGYECGLLLILAGARSAEGTSPRVGWGSRALTVLPQLAVVAAIVVACVLAFSGQSLSGGRLLGGIVLVTALFLRHLISSRDRDALTQRLQAREELFRSLVTGASDMVTLHDAHGVVTYASPAVERVLGRPQEHLVGTSLGDVVEPEDRARLGAAFLEVLQAPGSTAESLVRLRSASGEWRWMQVLLHNRLHDPSVRGVIGNTRDVHERHLLERQLGHAAFHDALTGLGNLAHARALLARCYEMPRPASVILIDLDGFKSVNDTFGHAHGDGLLQAVAERLSSCLRSGDEVARLGGDEFVILVHGNEDAEVVGDRVLTALRHPVEVSGTALSVGASLGIARTADASSPDEVLRNADLAMYASKNAGRDRITWYEPQMHASAARRMALRRGLRTAIDEGQLSLHYQPIVSLPGGETVGAEALLRWQHPEEGSISPEIFIPVAEEAGIIGEVDLWVLDAACRDIARWRAGGAAVPTVSVNLSRRHMTLDLPGVVAAALGRHGLPGQALCIEVTESAVVTDAAAAVAALTEVRAMGVDVALDDFGTGQSSLSQLARLPVDTVKIDRSFIQSAGSDAAALRLLTSIVGVCQALSLPVVAEGIEHPELAQFLAGIGCDRGQGHHFGMPQPADAFSGLLGLRLPVPRPPGQVAAPR